MPLASPAEDLRVTAAFTALAASLPAERAARIAFAASETPRPSEEEVERRATAAARLKTRFIRGMRVPGFATAVVVLASVAAAISKYNCILAFAARAGGTQKNRSKEHFSVYVALI